MALVHFQSLAVVSRKNSSEVLECLPIENPGKNIRIWGLGESGGEGILLVNFNTR